ncbi:hypothetical protein [Kitasatospora phosalacinea]|uniref:Uncharacterized protein n=1 Tax=Kitasatospora phosalacinea TaxID=2065 RepID=A0A9W6PNA6_9ACTN|nr:hypothetical protein [Kitasatospora phosalacinea]GLW57994.1 hypothetical protein Kpho01_60050 [Kitasatospora phosalacinea]
MPAPVLHCTVRRTESTLELLNALFTLSDDPGFEPLLLDTWSPGAPAEEEHDMACLAALLDEPLALRRPRTGHTPSKRLTWHCSIRSSPSTALTEDDWYDLALDVLDATGIDPAGDSTACRWAALQTAEDRIDIVATVVRQDGRWARLHNDEVFARFACEKFSRARAASVR